MAEKTIKKITAQPTVHLKDEIEVHFDAFEGLVFRGWGWNKNQPKKRLMLDVSGGERTRKSGGQRRRNKIEYFGQ